MSVDQYNSPEHLAMLKTEYDYNIPRLKKLREMLDSGEIKMNQETIVNNSLWKYGWVNCIGVECKIKAMSTKHECPLKPTKEGCWWIHAHEWRIANDKKRRGQPIKSIMRKRSEA